jgi:hypothetical protein
VALKAGYPVSRLLDKMFVFVELSGKAPPNHVAFADLEWKLIRERLL